MPESDNYLKSLKPFREILESSEADYRSAASDDRDAVIEDIIAEIREEAGRKRAKVADDDILQKVCVCITFSCML